MATNESSSEKLSVFISYSRADMLIADRLVSMLEAAGFSVLIDRRDLPYGEKWQHVLYEYICDCDTVVFLVSEQSIHSQWVKWELQQVTEIDKRLIPIMLVPCPKEELPPAVARIEVLPKEETFSFEVHATQLVTVLNTNRSWVMQGTRLFSRTRDWINADRKAALLLRGAALDSAESWRSAKPQTETISGDVLDFLLSSRQQANRRQRYWVAGSLAVALGASALAATAYMQSIEADAQRAEAQSQSREAARQSSVAARQANAAVAQSAALTSLASDNDPSRGLLLAHEALLRSQGAPTVTTVAARRNAIFRFGPTPLIEAGRRGLSISEVSDAYAPYRDEKVESLTESDNGRWLLVHAHDDELWRVDLEHKEPASTFRVIDTGLVGGVLNDAVISNSGRFVALTARSDPGVYVFDLSDNKCKSRLARGSEGDEKGSLVFSNDEQYLANGHDLWRLSDRAGVLTPSHLPAESDSTSSFFTADSRRIGVATMADSGVRITTWATSSLEDKRTQFFKSLTAAMIAYPTIPYAPAREENHHEAISSDRRWLISWSNIYEGGGWTVSRPSIVHYDKAGNRQHEWKVGPAKAAEEGTIRDVAFSGNGHWLATIGESLQIWDLTAKEPFTKPAFDLSAPGIKVAIDSSGRWVASFGRRLQIWDLSLPAPAAFPIAAKSLLEALPADSDADDLDFRFVGKDSWLLAQNSTVKGAFSEFWDLRFGDMVRDADLARRNLTQAEWRSFFGRARYHKTFPGQPDHTEPMSVADGLAREGNVSKAVDAYQRIMSSEAGLTLQPARRAARLAAQFYWSKGEDQASYGSYDAALKLLQRAKQLNPAIPWTPEARAGHLWARRWENIVDALRGTHSLSEDPAFAELGVEELLAELRKVKTRYPSFRFEPRDGSVKPGEGLYQLGLRAVAERARTAARRESPSEVLRLKAILAREGAPEIPSEQELAEGLMAQYKADQESFVDLPRARQFLEGVNAISPSLASRMGADLEAAESFQKIEQAARSGKDADAISRARDFRDLMGKRSSDSAFGTLPPRTLNSICWNGTTRYGLASEVLPACEAAVRSGINVAQYRDSRGVAYAAVGRFEAAIDDFQFFLSSGSSGGAEETRRAWIDTLTKCKANPAGCKNPFTDATFLQSLK